METTVIRESLQNVNADAWVLTIFSDRVSDYLEAGLPFPEAITGEIQDLLQTKALTGKLGQLETMPTFGMLPVKRLILVGGGDSLQWNASLLRQVSAAVAKAASSNKLSSIAYPYVPSDQISPSAWAQAVVEGARLATYKMSTYHQKQTDAHQLERLQIVVPFDQAASVSEDLNLDELHQGAAKGDAFAAGASLARDLVNMPANYLTPPVLAERMAEVANTHGVEVNVLDENEIQNRKMGALWAVGKGSVEPPRLIVARYEGDPDSSEWLALVGKGITFDTGGYSLKPKGGMEKMISDMGGSAAVIGALETIGRLKPKKNIFFVVAAAENMISDRSFKPGDVLISYSGKSIEMVNSDAEGRLVLADAITYVKELGATHIVDVATLTGGVITSLGSVMSGTLSNNSEFYRDLEAAAELSGEKIWRFPYDKEYQDKLKSTVADVINSTGPAAHAIMGGMFVHEFVGETPWIHIDIAGTAFVDSVHHLGPKGATGVMSRTLAHLAGC
jgi:leucyl aminopeptidase